MTYRTILVDLAAERPVGPRLDVASALASRFQATLLGMHVMPAPFASAGMYGEASVYVGPELIEAQRHADREIKERVRMVFEDVCGSGPDRIWREAEGDPGRLLAAAAHATDLVLTEKGDGATAPAFDVIDQLVVGAGVPVLVLPPMAVGPIGRTVLVAWNGSREATRAVHGALPFLRAAGRVILCVIGERAVAGLEDARAMLDRHGVKVQPEPVPEPDGAAGEILLARAAAHAADLLVMGAYGHARLRELVFGGATRHVLRAAGLPVLFAS